LKALFNHKGVLRAIEELTDANVEDYEFEKGSFDLIVAEGFLNCLPNGMQVLAKLCERLAIGNQLVVSFDEQYGALLENVKAAVLRRVCQLSGDADFHGAPSLELARQLFQEDFESIATSRPFSAWWEDQLVNPYTLSPYVWLYPDVMKVVQQAGCVIHSMSPCWTARHLFTWYKDVQTASFAGDQLREEWKRAFAYLVTGLPGLNEAPSDSVLDATGCFSKALSSYITCGKLDELVYPAALHEYLSSNSKLTLRALGRELKELFVALRTASLEELQLVYSTSEQLRCNWGNVAHYVCIRREE